MYCRKCGTQINDHALFCYQCGEKVKISSKKHLDIQFLRKILLKKKIFSCAMVLLIVLTTCSYCIFGKKTIIPEVISGNFRIYWNDSREDLAGRYSSFKPVNPKNWDFWKIDSGISAFATIPVRETHIYFKNDKLSSVVLEFDCHEPKEPPDFFSEEGRNIASYYTTYEQYKEAYEYEREEYLRKCEVNDIQCKRSLAILAKKLIGIYGEPLTKVENDMSSYFTRDAYTWDKDGTIITLSYTRDDDYTDQSITLSFKSKIVQGKNLKQK